jgi:hypothetical protein
MRADPGAGYRMEFPKARLSDSMYCPLGPGSDEEVREGTPNIGAYHCPNPMDYVIQGRTLFGVRSYERWEEENPPNISSLVYSSSSIAFRVNQDITNHASLEKEFMGVATLQLCHCSFSWACAFFSFSFG